MAIWLVSMVECHLHTYWREDTFAIIFEGVASRWENRNLGYGLWLKQHLRKLLCCFFFSYYISKEYFPYSPHSLKCCSKSWWFKGEWLSLFQTHKHKIRGIYQWISQRMDRAYSQVNRRMEETSPYKGRSAWTTETFRPSESYKRE